MDDKADNGSGGGFPAVIERSVQRWGVAATLAAGAIFLFAGLGADGLWEPWEMDRADLARTFVEPPTLPVALGAAASQPGGLADQVRAAADDAGVVARFATPPTPQARGAAAGARTVAETLTTARTEVVAGVLLELDLLVGDPADPKAWGAARRRLREATRYAGNGHVLLVNTQPGLDEALIRQRVAEELALGLWEDVAKDYQLDKAFPDKASIEQAIRAAAPELGLDDQVKLLSGADQAALADAMADSAAVGMWTVRFKDKGETRAVAPLDTWATALSYNLLGYTEFATRLPGVLFALLALWALLGVARRVWSPRVAVLAGLVLITTPLFFAQARSAVGETGALLGLTLVGGALILHAHGETKRVLGLLAAGLLVGFLAKGLFALTTYAVLVGGFLLVTGDRDARALKLGLVVGGALALAALWVFGSSPTGFAGQFRFTEKLFSVGPDAYHRNFDLAVHQIGFGAFPWSPFYVVGFATLVFGATRALDRRRLAVLLFFAVPTLMMMVTLKDLNQLIWPAAAAGALAVALLFDRVATRGLHNPLVAFAVFVMFLILIKELGASPRPLASMLTFDPPFASKGAQRFPESLVLARWAVALTMVGMLAAGAYFGRWASFVIKLRLIFRRPTPFAIAFGAAIVLLALTWLVRILSSYSTGMRLPEAGALAPHQKAFASSFLTSADPIVLLGWLTLATVGVIVLWRYVLLRGRFAAPAPTLPLVRRGLAALARRVGLEAAADRDAPASRPFLVAGVAWGVVGVSMVASVGTPSGYWGEMFEGRTLLLVAAGGGVVAWGLRRLLDLSLRDAAVVTAGALLLLLGARLGRDAGLVTWYSVGFTVVGWLAFTVGVAPRLWRSGRDVALVGGLWVALALLGWAVPLLDRWDQMVPLLYPEGGESLAKYLLVRSRVSVLLYAAILALLVNRNDERLGALAWRWRPLGAAGRLGRSLIRSLERGPVLVGVFIVVGVGFAGATVGAFYSELSYNVSQKHIIDTYRQAEGLGRGELGERIFRHGSFAAAGRKDANFYTASMPEIRDRNTALDVLLAAEDRAVVLETPTGTEARFLPGWDPANAGPDGKRAWPTVSGFATGADPGSLTDAKAQWAPDAHRGKLLVDSKGKTFPIVGNDATTLRLEGAGRPSFVSGNQAYSAYVIDDPAAPNHRASAPAPLRYYALMPAESFSAINHAFRQRSGGRHIPVLDGRSYRVLLTASYLEEGEEQQNRFALHTLSRPAFDALADPAVKKAPPGAFIGNYDDQVWVVGYKVEPPVVARGKNFTLTTYFQARKEIRSSYQLFLHIDRSGTSNRIHADHWPLNLTKHTEDDKSCVGCYRTDHWMPGDVVMDVYEGEVPVGTPSGPQDIWMGLYLPAGGKRLPVKDWDKVRARHDGGNRVRIGSFQVR